MIRTIPDRWWANLSLTCLILQNLRIMDRRICLFPWSRSSDRSSSSSWSTGSWQFHFCFWCFACLHFLWARTAECSLPLWKTGRKIGDVNSRLQDTLAGIRVVQSFANEDVEKEKFRKSNHNFLLSKDANYKCMGSFMGYNLFFQGMMYLVTLVFGGYLIAHGQMDPADLAMYALYIGISSAPSRFL